MFVFFKGNKTEVIIQSSRCHCVKFIEIIVCPFERDVINEDIVRSVACLLKADSINTECKESRKNSLVSAH